MEGERYIEREEWGRRRENAMEKGEGGEIIENLFEREEPTLTETDQLTISTDRAANE